MATLTTNYRFTLPAYDAVGWDTAMDNNLIAIDALLGQFNTGMNLQGIWQNSTLYPAGVSVINPATGFIYTAGVTNTSRAAPELMAADIAANPSWWTNITNPAISAAASATAAQASATSAASSVTSAASQATNAANAATSAAASAVVAEAQAVFRNRLINGGMAVNQRGSSTYAISAGTLIYTVDRWAVFAPSSTLTATSFASNAYGGTHALSLTGTLPNGDNASLIQRLEAIDVADLVGADVTVSFWFAYTVSAGITSFAVNLNAPTAIDNWTSSTLVATNSFVGSAGQTLVTATFPSLPSTVANGLAVSIVMVQSVADGNINCAFGSMQLEKGTTATLFERQPYSVTLDLSKRYYQLAYGLVQGYSIASATLGNTIKLRQMRTTPTVTSTFNLLSGSVTTTSAVGINDSAVDFSGIVGTTGQVTFNAHITASAEL